MSKINFAVIGCGHIGKRHAEMIFRNENCTLQSLVDIKPKDSLGLEAYNEASFFNSLDELIASPIFETVEVVNIATPNGLHAEQAIQCLNLGKHVVIEKPMALNPEDAGEILNTAEKMGKKIFCVMQNRYSPPSAWLKGVVESGILGNIYMVQLNCYWNRDDRYYKPNSWHGNLELDGGVLFTQFSHFIDLMYWLFGEIENVTCQMKNFNHRDLTQLPEDSGFAQFDFISGGMGCINFSTAVWDRNLESSMTVIAENGSLKVGGQYMDKVEYCHIRNYEMPELPPTNPGNDYGHYKGSAANHHYIIDNVVDVLLHNGTITTPGIEGLKVVEFIDKLYDTAMHQPIPKNTI